MNFSLYYVWPIKNVETMEKWIISHCHFHKPQYQWCQYNHLFEIKILRDFYFFTIRLYWKKYEYKKKYCDLHFFQIWYDKNDHTPTSIHWLWITWHLQHKNFHYSLYYLNGHKSKWSNYLMVMKQMFFKPFLTLKNMI